MKWRKVVTTDYYGAYEEAADLNNGDTAEIKWPDGTTTTDRIVIVDGHGSAQIDMNGHPDHFKTRKLYVKRKMNGVTIRLPLLGLMVRKV